MRLHLLGIQALIEPQGYAVYIGDVPDAANYPYVLLWASPGALVADEADGVQDDLSELVGVTMAGTTPDAVLRMAPAVRGALLGARPVVAGRHVQPLRLFDSQRIQIDTNTPKLRSTNRHPAYAVDLYRLISEPA